MKKRKAKVSIGLPVYNGENFLHEALDSLLNQTYTNFELVISDNASNDRTSEICKKYIAQDKRIRYFRNEKNIGAELNFNRVFELASGDYFKWAAHDDLNAPTFIEDCVNVLDQDDSVVLCYPRTKIIDEFGNFIRNYNITVDTGSIKSYIRLYNMLKVDHWCFQIFGIVRADILAKTLNYRVFFGFDRNILAELCLYGRVLELPEYLFFRREHSKTSMHLLIKKSNQFANFEPHSDITRFLAWKRFSGYFAAVSRAPLSLSERLMCYVVLMRLIVEKSASRVKGLRKIK